VDARISSKPLIVAAIALALVSTTIAVSFARSEVGATTGTAANKMAVAGSGTDIGVPGQVINMLTGTLKTSTPEDLIITVTAECSIVTSVTTIGDDQQEAFGEIKVWVTIDGHVIPVSSVDDTGTDMGKVVFCNRAHQQSTSGFNLDRDAMITTYLKTRTANAFQWITLNVGAGDHTIVAKAMLNATATNRGVADAVVGKRTLIVDPTKLAVDAVI
jgi:hypothetical protein